MNTIPKHPRKNIALLARSFSKLAYLAVRMIFSSSLAVSQVPPTSVVRSTGVMANDYFHTGAGARYLRRAEGDIATQTARGNKAPRRTTPDYDTPVNATEPSYLTGGFSIESVCAGTAATSTAETGDVVATQTTQCSIETQTRRV